MEDGRLYEEEDEFCSCCGEENDEDSLNHNDCVAGDGDDDDGKSMVEMYFKGVSIDGVGECGSGLVGIGVVFDGLVVCCVQKRLDFYVEGLVSEYLALIDGLIQVSNNSNVKRVVAFTDSKVLYEQVMREPLLCNPLMASLTERVLELAATLEAFSLKLVSSFEAERASHLAHVAIGLVSLDAKADGLHKNCSICCENKPSSMMLALRCSHKFCSQCLKTHADGKIQADQVPIKCPQLRCKYFISTSECKMFLPVISYDVFERKFAEHNALSSKKLHCPYDNCSALLDPVECISAQASSSCESNNSCIECAVCERSICVSCVVPWHNSLSCEEYQELPLEERDVSDISLYRLSQDRRWRRCQQCWRMIELTQGCYHLICWCGHEFCYFCGNEYRNGQQTCECALWDEYTSEDMATPSTPPEPDNWPWNSFDTIPMILDAYSDQERSQLALIQRFLAGGFSLNDHSPYQSPPQCTDSYVDAMKDLHQLPWLERFVSVISDNYYDDYIH